MEDQPLEAASKVSPPDELPAGGTYERRKACIMAILQAQEADWVDWRWQAKGVGSLEALEEIFWLTDEERGRLLRILPWVRATPHFLALANPKDPNCPIRRQISVPSPGVPISPSPLLEPAGPSRIVLRLPASRSALRHHCFRLLDGAEEEYQSLLEGLESDLFRLSEKMEVRDVVIGGGEPFALPDQLLGELLTVLSRSPADIEAVRMETRALSLLPQRFEGPLCSLLGRFGRPLYLHTQFNHPMELTPEAAEAARRLSRSGVVLQNRAILLPGVNDSPPVIASLHRTLLKIKVRPAFLVHCSPVSGDDRERGQALIHHLRKTISGLAVPQHLICSHEA